ALGNEFLRTLLHVGEIGGPRVEKALNGDGRGPLGDIYGREFRLAQMHLHPPAHGTFWAAKDTLLDDLHPSSDCDLECTFLSEPCLNGFLYGQSTFCGSLGPTDALRTDA